MAAKRAEVIDGLRTLLRQRDGSSVPDGELLERYVQSRDEAAFKALVYRHGPMVLGVCQRMLHHLQDAEDAFQATFLVLARKAASVQPRSTVRNWLYGVACRTAQQAKKAARRRQQREAQAARPEKTAEKSAVELLSVLDQELSRLPDRYRAVLVLCELEGLSQKETARQLELPEGTVASRSSRARAMLAKRLARHGFVLGAGTLAAVLPLRSATAAVPRGWIVSTVKAASSVGAGQAAAGGTISATVAALMDGVLKTMLLAKIKTLAVSVLFLGALAATATGFVAYEKRSAVAAEPNETISGGDPPAGANKEPPASKAERRGRGDWD